MTPWKLPKCSYFDLSTFFTNVKSNHQCPHLYDQLQGIPIKPPQTFPLQSTNKQMLTNANIKVGLIATFLWNPTMKKIIFILKLIYKGKNPYKFNKFSFICLKILKQQIMCTPSHWKIFGGTKSIMGDPTIWKGYNMLTSKQNKIHTYLTTSSTDFPFQNLGFWIYLNF